MSIESLRNRIFSDEAVQELLKNVVVRSIASQFEGVVAPAFDNTVTVPWKYLLTIASLFSTSNDGEHQDAALRIAQACLTSDTCSEDEKAAAIVILDDMANGPTIELADTRGLIPLDLDARITFGIRARLLRNRLESTVELADTSKLRLTRFQKAFWVGLENAKWVSVSAPTSAGKSFVITRWLIDDISERSGLTIYIVPTRALIGQVEASLITCAKAAGVDISVSTIPRGESVAASKPTILVFTQERMHLLLTQGNLRSKVRHVVVDEAQKIGDRHRGVLLQQVIEMLVDDNPEICMTFVSPMTENPEAFFRDAPIAASKYPLVSEGVTVNQNLLWVSQKPRKLQEWTMQVCHRGELVPVGDFRLSSKPEQESKRLPFISHALALGRGGNIVYVNRASDAEKTALLLYDLVGETVRDGDTAELFQLSDLVKDVVHKEYLLAKVLERGVAFHYGNIPQLVRTEVERLFSEGKIKYLVCTSTLIEGVNTSCRTICVREPKKGNSNLMSADDFWNLAGRAGRLGREFQGNVVCVDSDKPKLWRDGCPPRKRKRYVIERTTDEILSNATDLVAFCESRAPRIDALRRPDLEYVSTYLMLVYRKQGTLFGASWAGSVSEEALRACNDAIAMAWQGVEIPLEVAIRSPGINPMAMQQLLEYFRARTHVEGKPVEELLPADPGSDDAARSYAAIIARCVDYLNAALGPKGKRSFALAILVTRWMRGFPLARLIVDRVKLEQSRNAAVDLPGIIRSVLDDVERIARFEAPRTITAYLDVLRIFLNESGYETLASEIEDVGLFLEMGVSIPTQIALLGIGLSRSTAIQVSELISDDSMSEADVKQWLRSRTWESASLPALVKREIAKVLEVSE